MRGNVMRKDPTNHLRDQQAGYVAKQQGKETRVCPECGRTLVKQPTGAKKQSHKMPRPNQFMQCQG